ncbi:hypothetical protein FGG08_002266 [Glutinoglossum americanum]|uniref:Amino acid permease/ SLC12A domain-containing protein n=1 Tax=Glutinoglossum americanum TaxID=1670608 RepID=A0A9P8IFG7_9PEZI|nr:hypothetical protein FGG08_002266 [Glutinoglossum americanum]
MVTKWLTPVNTLLVAMASSVATHHHSYQRETFRRRSKKGVAAKHTRTRRPVQLVITGVSNSNAQSRPVLWAETTLVLALQRAVNAQKPRASSLKKSLSVMKTSTAAITLGRRLDAVARLVGAALKINTNWMDRNPTSEDLSPKMSDELSRIGDGKGGIPDTDNGPAASRIKEAEKMYGDAMTAKKFDYVNRGLKSQHIQFIALGGSMGPDSFSVSAVGGADIDAHALDLDAMPRRNGYMASTPLTSVLAMWTKPCDLLLDGTGVPYWRVDITASLSLLAYTSVLMTWASICVAYIKFYGALEAKGIDRNTLPFKSVWQPYAAWLGLICFSIIIIFNGFAVFVYGNWNVSNFLVSYIGIPICFALYLFWKVFERTKWLSSAGVDLHTGKAEIDRAGIAARLLPVQTPRNVFEKVWFRIA